MNTVHQIAEKLTADQRAVVIALCGNAWKGGRPTPGILLMNAFELMHIDALKAADGGWIAFKAKPTELGAAVRAHLLSKENEHD
ncbi:hypothetical protein AX777_04920 [Sphingobium yanoikuyae]|jgi:hypothetical protein|uniref:Uncharacterized protein n=1 Tax=Sphingobium yanoikuyae TaxID=13690 RepID=A0A177JP54_SPHYA|nr:hypothetical protein [Sphingobium yanoikuyae]OAH42594.1 hypothetical protein AX777_04920 [Sphingobium yanoikuyae]